jgi:hypothetical protein
LQAVELAAEKEPAEHWAQARVVAGEKVPPGQAWQLVEPEDEAFVPEAQLVQADDAPAALEYLPREHTVHLEAPTVSTKEPATQTAQLTEPVAGANLPAAQSVHEMLPVSAA